MTQTIEPPKYATVTDLFNKTEIEKACLLAYFHLKFKSVDEFTMLTLVEWFQSFGLATPNPSRLKQRIAKSSVFIKGRTANTFRIHVKEVARLDAQFPQLVLNEDVESLDTVLPKALYQVNRGYIESLGKQINASYEHNIFDGCAVLMRRLLEILLILAYEHKGLSGKIKDSNGNYLMLERIVDDAKNNADLSLSRNTKPLLDKFRELGNFSAHKIHYICKRQYIEEAILDYRATIEELEYKAGLK